jgi:hypothetical protein
MSPAGGGLGGLEELVPALHHHDLRPVRRAHREQLLPVAGIERTCLSQANIAAGTPADLVDGVRVYRARCRRASHGVLLEERAV